MSKSGREYTKAKIEKRNALSRRNKHPVRLFVKSWDFWGKLCVSIIFFGAVIHALYDSKTISSLWIIYAGICLPLYPFAKKCSDDIIRHYVSEKTFENIINGAGSRSLVIFYFSIIVPLIIPLSIGYFVYQIKKYRAVR